MRFPRPSRPVRRTLPSTHRPRAAAAVGRFRGRARSRPGLNRRRIRKFGRTNRCGIRRLTIVQRRTCTWWSRRGHVPEPVMRCSSRRRSCPSRRCARRARSTPISIGRCRSAAGISTARRNRTRFRRSSARVRPCRRSRSQFSSASRVGIGLAIRHRATASATAIARRRRRPRRLRHQRANAPAAAELTDAAVRDHLSRHHDRDDAANRRPWRRHTAARRRSAVNIEPRRGSRPPTTTPERRSWQFVT